MEIELVCSTGLQNGSKTTPFYANSFFPHLLKKCSVLNVKFAKNFEILTSPL